MMKINLFGSLCAIFYTIVETAYFGWNFTPKSDAEMICDGIGLLMLVISTGNKQ